MTLRVCKLLFSRAAFDWPAPFLGRRGNPPLSSLCWKARTLPERRCTLTPREGWCGPCCFSTQSTVKLTSSLPSTRTTGQYCSRRVCVLARAVGSAWNRFRDHLEVMFGAEDGPTWDTARVYTPDTIQVHTYFSCVLYTPATLKSMISADLL